MANPHYDQRRREEANEGGMHEHRDDEMSWTDRDDRGDRNDRSGHSSGRHQGESDQHHHHHHHHHGSGGQQSDRDYEKVAEEAHDRIRKGRRGQGEERHQHGGRGSQQGHDIGGDEHGHTNRRGSRGANDPGTARSPRTEGQQSGNYGGQQSGRGGEQSSHREQGREQSSGRRYGSRRQQRGRGGQEHGSPHEGSQRGSDREEGLSGRMTGQRGDSTHHSDPSDSTFRDRTMGQREHRHGGERGTSERDRRFGSRRGHGSERDRGTDGGAQRHHSTR